MTLFRSRRSVDGGIDEIPAPHVPGRLWLCGKHAIAPDPEAAMATAGAATTVVCLTEAHELEDRYPEYVTWLRAGAHDGRAIWFPIHDLHAPAPASALEVVDDLADRLRAGESVLVHCGAGIGRAGTLAVCVLMRLGLTRDEALASVAAHRPMAGPEAGAQRDLVDAIAALPAS